jgi:hypothetical protein
LSSGHLEHPAQQGHVVEVCRHALGDARVLHLDRHRAPVVGHRPVHLPDRRGGDRLGVPAGERTVRRQAEFLGDHARGQFRAHRRDAVLQSGQGAPDGGGQAIVHVAGHLAQLHQYALHGAQGVRDVLGGLQGKIVAQLLPVLAGRREQPWGVARVARPAAGGQAQRGDPAPQPEPAVAPAPPDQQQGGGGTGGGHGRGDGLPHPRCPIRAGWPGAGLVRASLVRAASSAPWPGRHAARPTCVTPAARRASAG